MAVTSVMKSWPCSERKEHLCLTVRTPTSREYIDVLYSVCDLSEKTQAGILNISFHAQIMQWYIECTKCPETQSEAGAGNR